MFPFFTLVFLILLDYLKAMILQSHKKKNSIRKVDRIENMVEATTYLNIFHKSFDIYVF